MADDRDGVESQQDDAEQSLQHINRGAIWVRAGRFMGIAGLVLAFCGQSTMDTVREQWTVDFWTGILLALGGVALFWGGLSSYIRGKRLQSVSAEARMAIDQRPPVLYLRSFKDDKVATGRPLAPFLGFAITFFGVTTEEEQLAEAMSEIGPFIAIGKPGENLPELGASRMYVSDAEWQNTVGALMLRSRLIVLRAADSEGFWWEVKHAVDNVAPELLVFLLPFKKDEYRRFRQRAETLLPCRLPEYQGGANLVGSRLRAMLYFDCDWTPHIEKLRIPFSLSLIPLMLAIKKALQPVIERLPSDIRRTPSRRRRRFAFLRTIPAVLLILFGISLLSEIGNAFLWGFLAVVHNYRGLALYEQQDLDGAIREYQRAVQLNPRLVIAYSNLGMAWYQKGNLDHALTEYGKALRLDQNVAVVRNNMGLALLKKGDLESAIAEFQMAVRLDPSLLVARENLCEALYGQKNFYQVVAVCREALRLNPSSGNSHYVLGNVAREQGDLATAVSHYREALRLGSPVSALAHNNLGWTLAETGNTEEAMAEYREAIRLIPDLPEAHVNLANALAAKGDWAGATIEFRTALRLLPNAAFLHYGLGLALNRQGEYAAAREELIKAYELEPENPNIRRTYEQIIQR